MSRRRPLRTCGTSLLAVIHTTCLKAQELNGPLGKWATRIIKFASLALPLMYVVLYQWLAILSFTDDCILTFEELVETIFPPSTRLFDKIDKLVYTAEVMPGRFDEALNRYLVIMHRAPFLDWALLQIIWWLYGDHMEERDIMIDMNSNTRSNVTESADNANCPSQEAPSIYCPPQEKIFEVGTPEINPENKGKYTVESSTMNQSRDLISASPVDSSQEWVDHVQLPSTAASLGRSSQERRKLVDHVQLPSIADPPGDSSQEKTISVDHVQWRSTAKKEGLPRNKILEDDTFQDKTKSIGVKRESAGIVKGAEKKTFGKQRVAENTREGSQRSSVSEEKVGRDKQKGTHQSSEHKDPVLELFESRWHL